MNNNLGNDFDVTGTVKVSSPAAVQDAVFDILRIVYPDGIFDCLSSAFRDFQLDRSTSFAPAGLTLPLSIEMVAVRRAGASVSQKARTKANEPADGCSNSRDTGDDERLKARRRVSIIEPDREQSVEQTAAVGITATGGIRQRLRLGRRDLQAVLGGVDH